MKKNNVIDMGYEKKYNDALKKAMEWEKKYILTNTISPDGIMAKEFKEIFPELAESEDEQAMRIIRKRMCYDPVPISDEDRRIVEAWLEKQKDLMPPTYVDPCDASWDAYYQRGLNKGYELGKQKEQKPAEWSEEDEKVIEAACALLSEYAGYYREKDMEAKDLQLFKVSQRLKSLRPSWKPSEEQMKALHNFSTGVFIGDGDCDALRSLYEQLKKL